MTYSIDCDERLLSTPYLFYPCLFYLMFPHYYVYYCSMDTHAIFFDLIQTPASVLADSGALIPICAAA